MATIVPLTNDYLKKRVFINLDVVKSFEAKPNGAGTVLHFIDGKETIVLEASTEIYQTATKLER